MLLHLAQALLAALLLLQVGGSEASNKAEAAPGSGPTDSFYIRHGRSKVRHSNEKEQLLRALRPSYADEAPGPVADNTSIAMTAQDYGASFDSAASVNDNGLAASSSGKLHALSSSIQSGNGQLFGSDYWRNSDANGSLVMQPKRGMAKPQTAYHTEALATELPDAGTTQAPVTHRIRKLHMKRIMESIRHSVDKGLGGKLSKNHRSLLEAEQLQGRPTDVSEEEDENIDETIGDVAKNADAAFDDDDGDADGDGDENNANEADADVADGPDLDEVLQLADELDLPANSLEDSYQNDEYITTTPTYATTKSSGSSDTDEVFSTFAPNPAAAEDSSAELNYGALPEGALSAKATTAPEHGFILHRKAKKVRVKSDADAMAHKQQALEQNKRLKSTANALTPYDANASADLAAEDYSADTNAGNVANNDEEEDFVADNEEKLLLGILRNETDELQFNGSVIISNALDARSSDAEAFVAHLAGSEPPAAQTTADEIAWPGKGFSLGPNQLASTSVGGIGLERQQSLELGEINFDDAGLDNVEEGIMDDGHIDNHNANGFPFSTAGDATDGLPAIGGASSEDGYENRFLAGVVDAANEDEIYDWDEISRNNRRNLMRGRDVVTKFLQIVETQHSLGSNCEAGTSLNLGEGVVDRYAQDRFRVEAEVAVNRANMLTRIFKMTAAAVQADVNLLHASVLSMVEFDDDIFAAGNCFDWNEHPAQPGLFCPFAYRLPPPNLGAIFAKDLATEYHYLGNTSEWFFQARKNAEKVIARNEQYLKSFHLYSNKTDERIEDDTLAVKYEDGRWSKPYYDCGGGNIWMLTYTVPFFGYENSTYHFKGTSGIDIDLRRVDIDQCPQRNTPGTTQPLNIFAGTDKCKQRTTMCEALKGLGFRRGSYKCICRKGYYFPDTMSTQKFFNGSLLEEEYEKLMLGKNSTYNIVNEYECLPCAEGCESCEDGSPCIAALNWPMRTSILVLACTVIGLLPPAAWFTFRYQQVKVVRAASPALLRVIALGAFFIYCTNIVMYPNPNLYTCTARIWMREIGFSLTYGALMLKTWRISVIFRVRSAKAVKITDAALLKRLGIICGVIGTCLLVRTLVSPPDVVVGRTADDLKAFLCKTDWWDYTFTSMEVLFLAWGVRLCIMVRKAPSEFNESRFISMAIYNEFLLTCFLNVSMLFLQSPANPDLLYIIFFCHTQLTVTLLLGLIFGSKVYIVLRSGKSHQESIGLGAKSSGAKFNFRPQVRTFANPSSVTTSTAPVAGTTSAETKLSDQEALEEIRQLSMQLQRIQEMAPPKGVAVMTISSLLDGLKTPGGMMMVAAAASQAASTGNQLTVRPLPAGGALPLLSLNGEMQKYNQQLHAPQNNNVVVGGSAKPRAIIGSTVLEVETSTTTLEEPVRCEERAMNTDLTRAEDFHQQALGCVQGHIICSRCLVISREHHFSCRPFTPPTTCQQLGSPQPEGSISFANIKLECMCSQPDDLDADVPPRRRTNVRSAATNTPPPTGASTRRRGRSSPHLQEADTSVSYRICDNCKVKFRSNKSGGRKFRKSSKCRKGRTAASASGDAKSVSASGISQTRSSDLLGPRRSSDGAENSKKVHSTDDIIFYTTTDASSDTSDDDDADEEPNSCLRRRRQIIGQSTSSLSAAVASCSGNIVNAVAAGATAAATQIDAGAAEPVAGAEAVSQSAGNVSTASNSGDNSHSNNENQPKPNDAGRSKRPDKLILDLNDRSKYTKEVSV